MYKSPITIIESAIDSFSKSIIKQKDDAIFAEIQSSFGVDVDRQELVRALQYDRNQYDKGYADGKRDAMDELVRCKDCKNWKFIDNLNPHCECQIFYGLHEYGYLTGADDYCSYGERKDNG